MSSIFDISYEMNGPLPFYHPDHIIHYVMWGKMDLVHCALVSLNNFFKQFVDDDDNTINEFPPVSFPKMLKLQNVSSGSCGYELIVVNNMICTRISGQVW